MSSPNGPKPGSTPSDDAELRGNGDNPYNLGSPSVDGRASTTGGFGVGSSAPQGYYTNPPVDGSGNPFFQGATGWDKTLVDLDSVYQDVMTSRQPNQSDKPAHSDYWQDSGFGDDGEGRS